MTRSSLSIASLMHLLNTRAGRAVLALLGLRSPALRADLRRRFERQPGADGSFLSDPVIEGAFSYEAVEERMRDLPGDILTPELVRALDAPGKGFAEQRFPADRRPYRHQVAAWHSAKDPDRRGYVVSSGTGSGKTETFLFPILDDLIRESSVPGRRQLLGTRALFLYPLNALINSQRERLTAWTRSFNGNIRFCLYNGETREDVPAAKQRAAPEEILSRSLMRDQPAPILVTNATMLEYMLVRQDDAPILEKSKGMLRWIVIEAHTYVGSQAAELSMLMRRVIHAFGVEPSQVKFVATSATLGSDSTSGRDALARFIADVAGARPDQVDVIFGRRFVPPMDDYARTDQRLDLPLDRADNPADLYERLASSAWFRRTRQFIAGEPQTLSRLLAYANADGTHVLSPREMLEFLDRASEARRGEDLLLPLRVHLFHRTQSGVWACVNSACSARKGTPLDVPEWPFGGLLMARRETCPDCSAIVLELARCNDCGAAYLACNEESRGLDRFIVPGSGSQSDRDEEFELVTLEDEQGETDEDADVWGISAQRRLIAIEHSDDLIKYRIDPWNGEVFDHDAAAGIPISVLFRDERERFVCPTCGEGETKADERFRSVRVGAPFLLNVAIPTLLEHTPPADSSRPMDGRRIITFSDSRQGTARFAVASQLDADRNHARSVVYHQLLAAQRGSLPDIEKLEGEIASLAAAPTNPYITAMIEERKRALEQARNPVAQSSSWKVIGQEIQHDHAIRTWAAAMWDEVSFGDVQAAELGEFYLLREFARRPRRESTLETMGLIELAYPHIDRIEDHQMPAVWRERGATVVEWRQFLTAIVDHFLRANSAVEVIGRFINWSGVPVRTRYVLPPRQEPQYGTQLRWPAANQRRARIPRLLATGLGLDLQDSDDRIVTDLLLEQAWTGIHPMLKRLPDGFVMSMKEAVALRPVTRAFKCPVTGRLLANTFRALSPYAVFAPPSVSREAMPVSVPVAPHSWWQDPSGRNWTSDEINVWLETTAEVVALRSEGLWSDRHDRVLAGSPFFRVVEHSAQQEGARLLDYEKRFREGEVNVMSCSTTMEMGVDIGGVSAVAMNNAPPGPANFLQRAGRAGRRNETTTASLTLCKSDPHGEAVFRNPLWPFRTPIFVPRVSLDSATIIQRHVNAFLLGCYFRSLRADVPKLTAGWFFNDGRSPSPAEHFAGWARGNVNAMAADLERLLANAHLRSSDGVVERTIQALTSLSDEWRREITVLNEQISFFTVSESRETPAQMAAARQRERLVGEYLLRELTVRGFLPAYGFPANVVPFIPTTLKQLRRERAQRNERKEKGRGREDFTARRRGYPSREIAVGIRDYAPGNQTVIDGRVYESSGVTLNWHIPPGDTQIHETQVFSQAWRCRRCGATGADAVRRTECSGCHHSEDLVSQTFLQPAGFAVDISYQPHNRLDTSRYVPVEDPWITSGAAEWQPFEYRLPLRIRWNTAGHVFHYSRGLYGDGFAVCLRCGRAESVALRSGVAPLREHKRLRGGKEMDGITRCEGNDHTWAIKSPIWLGASTTTNVFEMQFTGGVIAEGSAAYSLAIVLRNALAAKLGIEPREIGPATIQARGDANQRTHSIVLFDRASLGAGYATEAPNHVAALLSEAAGRLVCDCDRACQRCLLTYETQFNAGQLDRLAALRLLG